MPQLKQPPSLQNTAMDNLSTWLANRCDELSTEDSLDKLREFIDAVKENIGPSLPEQLSSEFHKEFLYKFGALQDLQNNCHGDVFRKVVLEVIMDRKIIDLKCDGSIVSLINPEDANRLQGLRVLHFYRPNASLSLANFQLQDLTTLGYRVDCTDDDLKIIGKNCPKLVSIDVFKSKNLTNEGLRCLTPCSQLRVVNIACCRLSYPAITEFMTAHRNLETIRAWAYAEVDGFDCFSHTDSNVYPSIHSFCMVSDTISNEHLNTVGVKFPNLTSLALWGRLSAADICSIKSFDKLTRLDLGLIDGFTWNNLNSLLRFIGVNITDLRTSRDSCVVQSDLDDLFKFCGNIERLAFHHRTVRATQILAIPPFKKLKVLKCQNLKSRRLFAELKFTEMLELEDLLIRRFLMTEESIRSMIFDHINFPKLKELRISEISGQPNAIDSITQLANINNLDLEIMRI